MGARQSIPGIEQKLTSYDNHIHDCEKKKKNVMKRKTKFVDKCCRWRYLLFRVIITSLIISILVSVLLYVVLENNWMDIVTDYKVVLCLYIVASLVTALVICFIYWWNVSKFDQQIVYYDCELERSRLLKTETFAEFLDKHK